MNVCATGVGSTLPWLVAVAEGVELGIRTHSWVRVGQPRATKAAQCIEDHKTLTGMVGDELVCRINSRNTCTNYDDIKMSGFS